jgi:hypothetical protein
MNSLSRPNTEFNRGRLLLVQRCMKRFGFSYPLPPDLPPTLGENEKRFSLADPKRAATVGYHDPEEDECSRRIGATQSMTSEEEAVLNGLGDPEVGGEAVPEGGCNAEALAKLGGGPGSTEDYGHSLAQKSYSLAMADSRVVKVNEEWVACMKSAGHDYPDPLEPAGDERFTTDVATEAEIVVAVADVKCKQQVNYLNVRAAVEIAYQKREIERNKAALDAAKARNEEVMRQVAKVVSGRL